MRNPPIVSRRVRAASMAEYALIIVLVSIVSVGVLALAGPAIGDVFSDINATMEAPGGGGGGGPAPLPGDLVVAITPDVYAVTEPGGNVDFAIHITNTTPETITIDSLNETMFGNVAQHGSCTNAVGYGIGAGSFYSCSHTGAVSGSVGAYPNTLTVQAHAQSGQNYTRTAAATVNIVP